MSFNALLHHRLSPDGCRKVGQELEKNLGILQKQNTRLTLTVEAEANRVLQRVHDLEALGEDASMSAVDQGTDRMIAGFFGLFSARELCYSFTEVTELEPREKERYELCRRTRMYLFPDGTRFVQEPYEEQWRHLDKLQQTLSSPEAQAAIHDLGMDIESARLLRWIDSYGKRVGATQTISDRDVLISRAVERFHLAWEDFTLEVRHAFKDHSPESNRICLLLLSGYDRQSRKEEEIQLQSSGLERAVKK
jgi:hypothetical protein